MLPTETTVTLAEGNHINEKFETADNVSSYATPTTNGNTKHSHVS